MVTRDEADKASAYLDAACTTRGWTEDDREELVSMLGLDDPDFVTTPTISTSETNEAP